MQIRSESSFFSFFFFHLLKGLVFFHWTFLALLLKITQLYVWGLISGVYIPFHWSMWCLCKPWCFDYCSFIANLKLESRKFPTMSWRMFIFEIVLNTIQAGFELIVLLSTALNCLSSCFCLPCAECGTILFSRLFHHKVPNKF